MGDGKNKGPTWAGCQSPHSATFSQSFSPHITDWRCPLIEVEASWEGEKVEMFWGKQGLLTEKPETVFLKNRKLGV